VKIKQILRNAVESSGAASQGARQALPITSKFQEERTIVTAVD
jgi:hypothetical protein